MSTPRLEVPPLSPPERLELRALISRYGEVGTAHRLGVSRTTLARAVAGFALRRGTTTLLRSAVSADSAAA